MGIFGTPFNVLSPVFFLENTALLLLLTFGVTFLYLEIFFYETEIYQTKKNEKNMEKMEKRMGKLADLVCTRGFFLYKSGQVLNKCEQVCYLTSLLSLAIICTTWQARPNATKCGQEEKSFADEPQKAKPRDFR